MMESSEIQFGLLFTAFVFLILSVRFFDKLFLICGGERIFQHLRGENKEVAARFCKAQLYSYIYHNLYLS